MAYDERPDEYYIPDNIKTTTLFGIQLRNIIEAGVLELIVFVIFRALPFTNTINIVIGIILAFVVGVFAIVGVKNESLTEFIVSFILFKRKKKKLHYRRCDNKNAREKEIKRFNADKFLRNIEEKFVNKLEDRTITGGQEEGEDTEGQKE